MHTILSYNQLNFTLYTYLNVYVHKRKGKSVYKICKIRLFVPKSFVCGSMITLALCELAESMLQQS